MARTKRMRMPTVILNLIHWLKMSQQQRHLRTSLRNAAQNQPTVFGDLEQGLAASVHVPQGVKSTPSSSIKIKSQQPKQARNPLDGSATPFE